MMNYSKIVISVHTSPVGAREAITYTWAGDSPWVLVHRHFLFDAVGAVGYINKIQLGPYSLLMVERRYDIDAVLYVRADKLGALRIFAYRATRWLDLAYRRLIITLAVWRLADYHQVSVPTWKDVYALKRIADLAKRIRRHA